MPEDRLDELLSIWQRAGDDGKELSAEELCRECPELIPEVARRIEAVRQIERLAQAAATPRGDSPDASAEAETVTPRTSESASATKAQTSTGKTIGEYELLTEIARGGMGVVYKARHRKLGRLAAVKMILGAQFVSEEQVKRFYAEAEAAAHLDHPGIVPVYEVGEHAGEHCLAMAFVDGQSLWQRVKECPLEPREAARLMEQVAEAVHHAHTHGIVHRDLKPQNILVTADSQPRVTDFGLAKRLQADSSLTATGQVMGTPSYMPPEQAMGRIDEVGVLSDVYSLGATLYCTITGHPPFQAATLTETLRQVCEADPVSPRLLNPSIPLDLETICLKCLRKEPGRRYTSAQELAADLGRYLCSEPIHARPVGSVERIWLWSKQRPARAISYLLTTLLVLLFLVAFGLVRELRLSEYAAEKSEEARKFIANLQSQTAKSHEDALQAYEREVVLKTELEQMSYLYQISMAHREWRDGNVGRSMTLLKNCPDRLRAWEWEYVHTLCSPETFELQGHQAPVWSVAWDSINRQIATASSDGSIRLWDAMTGKETRKLTGVGSQAWGVAFSRDGLFLAGCGSGRDALIWDARTGDEINRIESDSGVINAIDFSPDGKILACVTGSINRMGVSTNSPSSSSVTLREWRSNTTVHAEVIKTPALMAVDFSPDGEYLAVSGWDGVVRIKSVQTNMLKCELRGDGGNVRGVKFSPDGERLASASENRAVILWDIETQSEVWRIDDFRAGVSDVAFTADGETLACISSDQTIRILESKNAKTRMVLRGHSSWGLGLAYSPDDTRLVSVGADKVGKVWDVMRDPESQALSGHSAWVSSTAFSPKQDCMATGSYGGISLWNRSGRLLGKLQTPSAMVNGLAFSPSGDLLVSVCSDGTIQVWDMARHQLSRNWKGHVQEARSVAFRGDGSMIATVGFDNRIHVWAVGEWMNVSTFVGGTRCVAFSADGRRIVAGGEDGVIRVWDTGSQALLHSMKGHENVITAIAIHADSKLLASGSWDSTVRLWDLDSGEELRRFEGHGAGVLSIAFSPDGERFVTSSDDRLIKVIVTASCQEALSLSGHTGPVYSIAVSPDGRSLLSGSWDGTARLWTANKIHGESLTPELRADRDAVGLLKHLCANPISKEEFVRAIQDTTTISETARKRALELAEVYWIRECLNWPSKELQDSSFESFDLSMTRWRFGSWQNDPTTATVRDDVAHEGKRSLRLVTERDDDISVSQEVTVRPQTDYLLSGWVKTENVKITEPEGKVGANLSLVDDRHEHSESLTGTSDWKHLKVKFNSGTASKVRVAARLGHFGSTCTGIAWFDDVSLIELTEPTVE